MKRKFNKEHKEWREKILRRDDFKCVVCGNGPKYLNAHHILPSEFSQFALETNNGLTLCPHCHTLGKFSAHKNPLWFTNWLSVRFPHLFAIATRRLHAV